MLNEPEMDRALKATFPKKEC